ncbi:MAG TPA: glutathione S-transferase family protein, partial [Pseudolabrys sp.]|nr:glutathione S-transferase family protein [Pseudolabrys sp.]
KESCVPLVFERIVKQILGAGPPDEAAIKRALENFARDAKMLEAHLAKQPYLVGSALTLADFSVAGPLLYHERAGIPLGDYPTLRDWFGRVTGLPCWKETAPQFSAAAA